MTRIGLVVFILIGSLQLEAQQVITAPPTICYGSGKNEFTSIRPPAEYFARKSGARTQSATIEVTYLDFTPEAQAAFQAAVDIWESLITSPVKIRIRARWTPLGPGVLGSAGPGVYVNNFQGAPKQNVWYPVALAEKIAGEDINSTNDFDIEAAFSSAVTNWHFGLVGSNPPANKYDLASIVLHEIGHGLGITHAYTVGDPSHIPSYFEGKPVVYETNLESNTGKNFVNDFNPATRSIPLENIIQGGNTLFFDSPLVRSANTNLPASIYAPNPYSAGSSIAHLDEDTYPAGTVNSLMTPQIGTAERMLDPGPITKNILKEIGWTVTVIQHTPLKDTENTTGPYHVVAKVRSDNGYHTSSVKINYKTTGSFTVASMTATANANEYKFDLPGGPGTYSYYITVTDTDNRTFASPGTVISPNHQPVPGVYSFTAGPDNEPPHLSNHIPVALMTNLQDLNLKIDATDNVGLDFVRVEWRLNGDDQPDQLMSLKAGTDSTYVIAIDIPGLQNGDLIAYRIVAQDISAANNISYEPDDRDFHFVTVTGLREPADSYTNDFDDMSSDDFFGNGFIVKPIFKMNNGAINSDHPYAEAGDAGHLDFIYSLKVPILIAPQESFLTFDEIVLVEPGTDGVPWPDPDFFDYVVVEGSTDGGTTWIPLADGYDSRYDKAWKTLWLNTFNGSNSTGVPDPSLWRKHSFNLLDKFKTGDVVAFRFRLYSDPLASGWGWAIDNLKIQIDQIPPTIRHKHYDYILEGTTSLDLDMMVTDYFGVSRISVQYLKKGGTETSYEIIVDPTNIYSSTIDLSALGLKAGDEFQYVITAIDSSGNSVSFPPSGLITTSIISFSTPPLDELVDTFKGTIADIGGNFLRALPFLDAGGRMATDHPYETGLGIDGTSDFTFMTTKPIKVASTNSRIYYEDIALVEYSADSVKDYVVVEATKDGVNWHQLLSPYAANAFSDWQSMYDTDTEPTGTTSLQRHEFDITSDGTFKAGDLIFIRFRLHSDSAKTGYGWVIDNLNIQSSVTGLEPQYETGNSTVCPWPNPIANGSLYLKLIMPTPSNVDVEIINAQGQLVSTDQFSAPSGDFQREYDVTNWSTGLYLIKVKSDYGTSVLKLIKAK